MKSFFEGTLIISNILLILLSIIYGYFIVKKKKTSESKIWIYFVIGSALFFISEIISFLNEFYNFRLDIIKSILQICFGILILFAFITKYHEMES
ncbi:hypothetical protein GF327_00105 [Candidatus Woesearchaeota archaeon]|nr:hypothetical protein [Candidatus Woesearchaeota archaeon]